MTARARGTRTVPWYGDTEGGRLILEAQESGVLDWRSARALLESLGSDPPPSLVRQMLRPYEREAAGDGQRELHTASVYTETVSSRQDPTSGILTPTQFHAREPEVEPTQLADRRRSLIRMWTYTAPDESIGAVLRAFADEPLLRGRAEPRSLIRAWTYVAADALIRRLFSQLAREGLPGLRVG
jgi:hypothetical protein